MTTPSPDALQREASHPLHSAWVSASAGSGKTKVLVDRVLRLLLAGAQPSTILCITFTKNAAAEMRSRIQERLGAWVTMTDKQLAESLEKLSGHPADATTRAKARSLFAEVTEAVASLRIETIHGFCQALLERFPLEAGISPAFAIAEEKRQQELLAEARHQFFSAVMEVKEGHFLYAAVRFISLWGEVSTREIIKEAIARRRELEPRLHGSKESYDADMEAVNAYEASLDALRKSFSLMDEAERQQLLRLVPILLQGKATDIKTGEQLQQLLQAPQQNDAVIENLTDYLVHAERGDLKGRLYTKDVKEKYPAIEELLTLLADRLEAYKQERMLLATRTESAAVRIIIKIFYQMYVDLKVERGLLDYDDLIIHAVNLLTNSDMMSWVLFKLDGGVHHLLLDEAQDTSPDQWRLVKALTTEFFSGSGAHETGRTLFVVGDSKQSIFSFQGADPAGYMAELPALQEKHAAAGQVMREVPFTVSFRSASAILRYVDATFNREGFAYGQGTEKIIHHAHRATAIGRVELWPVLEVEEEEKEPWMLPHERSAADTKELVLATQMVEVIADWIHYKRPLVSTGKPVQPGDILILVRSRGKLVPHLSRLLKQKHLPVAGIDRLRLNQHIAVEDLLSLGKFLLNPSDNLSLAEILVSPLYGLSQNMLFTLCAGREGKSVWERLQEYAGDDAETLAAREELQHLLGRTDFLSPYELYMLLLYARGGKKRFVRRMGSETAEILELFMAEMMGYETEHRAEASLQHFIQWMESMESELKREMEEGGGKIRIMTVHAAKGLEAPIVFLPDMAAGNKNHPKLYLDEAETLWYLRGKEHQPRALHYLEQARAERAAQEEGRLLYVALTRARDELYLCGVKGKKKKLPDDCWYQHWTAGFAGLPEAASVTWAQQYPRVPHKAEGNILFHQNSGVLEMPKKKAESAAWEGALPAFLDTPPAHFKARLEFASPSRVMEDAQKTVSEPTDFSHTSARARERGNIIHRLLELMPLGLAQAERRPFAERYLARYAAHWSMEEKERATADVLALVAEPSLSLLFSPGVMAEAPVVGMVEGKPYTGQIDRMVVGEREILIADFKTGLPPAGEEEISRAYREQMRLYKALIEKIYPDKTIRCILIYTCGPVVKELPLAA